MTRDRNPAEVRQYDLRKYTVLIVLALVLIILFIFNGIRNIQPVAVQELELTPVPTFTVVGDVVRPVLISPSPGEEISAGVVLLVGSGAPNAPIQIVVGGIVVGETTSDADGNWQAEVELLAPGENELFVQPAGAATADPEPVKLLVVVPVVEVQPPSLDLSILDGEIAGGEIALTGTGEPGSQLQIVVDGQPAETIEVDEDGRWAVTTALAEPGQYAISLSSLDRTGSVVAMATAIILDVVAVDATATDDALMDDTAIDAVDSVPAEEVEVEASAAQTSDETSDETSEPSSPEVAVEELPLAVDPAAGPVAPGFVTLSGTGVSGSEVTLRVDDLVVGRATVEPDGTWVFVTRLGELGVYDVSATDEAGQTSSPVAITVADAEVDAEVDTVADPGADPGAESVAEEVVAPPALDEGSAERSGGAVIQESTSQAPTINSYSVAGDAEDPSPFVEISGGGQAGDEVTITVDEVVTGRAMVGDDASWLYVTRLSQPGVYTVVAAGSDGASSAPLELILPPTEEIDDATNAAVDESDAAQQTADEPSIADEAVVAPTEGAPTEVCA